MPWLHNYSAVGHSLGLTAMVAALPIFFLFWALAYKRMKGYVAASLTLLLMLLVAVTAYGMPARAAVSAAVLGMVSGLWPIGWIILTAVFFYNLTVEGGQSGIIESSISSLSGDRRLQALLIAFCFSAFLEGVSGEGAPVAVAAAMLIGLGFKPLTAAVVCLVANTPPTPFGPVGVPTSMMISVTNINGTVITRAIGSDVAILALVIPFLVLIAISGFKRTIEVWPAALVAGLSYAVACFVVSRYLGVELPAIISSFVSMVCLIVFLKFWKPKQIWHFAFDSSNTGDEKTVYTRRQVLTAWSPYLLLMSIMSFWGTPAFTRFVENKLHWVLNVPHWPGLDGIVFRTAPIVDVPTMYPASYRWTFLTAPGTAMLICAIATMAILRISPSRGLKVFRATCNQLMFALVTLAAVVGIGYLSNYSGISYTLGLACASYAGRLFPIFSPAIGWLGVFLTGSVTSSSALFGKLQQVTATQTGISPVLTTSANLFGGVAGKLISPQSIAIACAATGLVGRETDIFRKTIKYSLALLSFVVVIVLLQAWVVPGAIPVDPETGIAPGVAFGTERALKLKGESNMSASTRDMAQTVLISGVMVPDSKLAQKVTELVRDTEPSLLFNHSTRVYYFGSLAGQRRGLKFDPELLYVAAMFHDMGLTRRYSSKSDRFEVDGANAAKAFLRQHNISQPEIDTVWTAIALHTTPGIPQYMHPVVALLTNGVEMDVLGIAYSEFSDADRDAIVAAYPRTEHFKEDVIQAFYDGIKRKPETTFGNVKADVLADKDPKFHRMNFCSVIRGSPWKG